MARHPKVGLDYFPLDVDVDQDAKIAMVEAVHGPCGFAVAIKLLMKIYQKGYFCEWDKREQILFAKRINVDINTVTEIVNDCINEGLFNRELYETYNILTSKGIQKRYLEAVKRRQQVTFNRNYFLIGDTIQDIVGTSSISIIVVNDDEKRIDVNINPKNVADTSHDANISTQSKVKESKEESKVKESKEFIQTAGAKQIKPKFKFEGPLKILDALNHHEIEYKGFSQIERMESFQNVLNDDLILYAIERAEIADKPNVNYVLYCLADWTKKGYAALADHPDHKERGNGNERRIKPNQAVAGPPAIDYEKGRTGWINKPQWLIDKGY